MDVECGNGFVAGVAWVTEQLRLGGKSGDHLWVALVHFFFFLCWSQFWSGGLINSTIPDTKSVIYMGWAKPGLDAEVFDCAVGILFILAHYTSRAVGIYCDKLSQCVHQGRQPAPRGKLVSDSFWKPECSWRENCCCAWIFLFSEHFCKAVPRLAARQLLQGSVN